MTIPHDFDQRRCDQDVHEAFGLSYASYLVVPRTLLEEMPAVWQHALTGLLEEFNAAFPGLRDEYAVFKRGDRGRYVADPLRRYRYPDHVAVEEARKQR